MDRNCIVTTLCRERLEWASGDSAFPNSVIAGELSRDMFILFDVLLSFIFKKKTTIQPKISTKLIFK